MSRIDIPVEDGFVFKSAQGPPPNDEVYGWLEKDQQIVMHSMGWWRTNDPNKAAAEALARARSGRLPESQPVWRRQPIVKPSAAQSFIDWLKEITE